MSAWQLLLVACGGFLGTICRYILGERLMRLTSRSPVSLAIQIINVLGSFGIGLLTGAILTDQEDTALALFLGVGFFGAFSTFSTFSVEALEMLQKRLRYGVLYILGTLVGCLLFFWLGYLLGHSLIR